MRGASPRSSSPLTTRFSPAADCRTARPSSSTAAAAVVGTAAIQLARQHDCRILVTAGSAEKIARCIALGADAGINYRTEDFVARTRELTDGRGADLVLDIMGASYLGRKHGCGGDRRSHRCQSGCREETRRRSNLGVMMRRAFSLISTALRARPAAQKA